MDHQVIYHRKDLDGVCSAAIVKKYITETYPGDHINLTGWDYADYLDGIALDPDAKFWLLDLTFKPEIMEELADRKNVTQWYDHHPVNIKACSEAVQALPGKRCVDELDDRIAACECVWIDLFGDPVPRAVRYIGWWDTWLWRDRPYSAVIERFQAGMFYVELNPDHDVWSTLLDRDATDASELVDYIAFRGEISLEYRKILNKRIAKKAVEMSINGYNVLVLNGAGGSTVLDSVYDSEEHDYMLMYYCNGSSWTASMYADNGDIDLGAKAKELATNHPNVLSGGGHRKAAGIVVKNFATLTELFGIT